MRHNVLTATRSSTRRRSPGRRRHVLGWLLVCTAFGNLLLVAASVRYMARWAREIGPLSVSVSIAHTHACIWVATKTGVMGSYDVGFHSSRATPANDEGVPGRMLDGQWKWFLAPGGNEVIAPNTYTVWRVPGLIDYDHNTSMWADGGSARSLSFVLWPMPLLAALAAGFCFVSARRARRRALPRCIRCGHDRRGLASANHPCPECGAPGSSAPEATSVQQQ